MKKPLAIAVAVVVLAAVAAGSWYWWKWRASQVIDEGALQSAQRALDAAAKGALPEVSPSSKAAERLPDTNPLGKTNPFNNVYRNPFE